MDIIKMKYGTRGHRNSNNSTWDESISQYALIWLDRERDNIYLIVTNSKVMYC